MKKYFIATSYILLAVIVFSGCKKQLDNKDLYIAPKAIATPVSDAVCLGTDPLNNAIKGVMLAGKTYNVCALRMMEFVVTAWQANLFNFYTIPKD